VTRSDLRNIDDVIDEVPDALCPKCGAWVPDFDGFGVLSHAACGYCKHPSRDNGVCGICGEARP